MTTRKITTVTTTQTTPMQQHLDNDNVKSYNNENNMDDTHATTSGQ
jgi:hypothetical protein